MKNTVLQIIIFSLMFLVSLAGCSNERPSNKDSKQAEKVSSVSSNLEQKVIYDKRISKDQPVTGVIVTINQGQMGYPVLKLETTENIKRTLEIDGQLENYKDVSILTMPLDVELKYILKSGQIVTRSFKGIRPINKYFKEIFNTLEAKKQMIPIFKVNPNQVTKVKFTSLDHQYVWKTADKSIIKESFDNILKHYEETNYYGDQREWVTIANVDFYINKKVVASGIILRGESQWDKLFTGNTNIKKIKTNPDDVKSITLTEYGTGNSVTVNDIDAIKKILDTYLDGAGSASKVTVDITLKTENMQGGHVYGSYDLGTIPDFITTLLNMNSE